jgi:hypothetical protein
MRVLTWNLLWRFGQDWPARGQGIAATLEAIRPDQAGVEVGVAVLSRWPVLEVHRHRLPSRRRPEIVALEVVADHPQGPLRLVTTPGSRPAAPPTPATR